MQQNGEEEIIIKRKYYDIIFKKPKRTKNPTKEEIDQFYQSLAKIIYNNYMNNKNVTV